MRFPNEVQAVKQAGGVVIRMERDLFNDDHKCESALDKDQFDWNRLTIIPNSAVTIPQLTAELEEFRTLEVKCSNIYWSSSYNNYAYCEQQYFMTYVLGRLSKSGKKADGYYGPQSHGDQLVLKDMQDRPRAKTLKVDDDAVGEVKVPKTEPITDDW